MKIFAHRGLVREYPENSLQALTAAMSCGFAIETDVRFTADQDFVLIHDATTGRLTGTEMSVLQSTVSQIEALTYTGTDIPLTSLRQFLEWERECQTGESMAIQVKADSQTKEALVVLATYWRDFDLYDQAFVFDLSREAAEDLKGIDERIQIALIVSDVPFEPTVYRWETVEAFAPMDIVWAAEYRKLYSREFVTAVKATGRPFYAVSPDVHRALRHPLAEGGYEAVWRHLEAWGGDGVCTDEPRRCFTTRGTF